MKKMFFILSLFAVSMSVMAQHRLPFSEYLDKTNQELVGEKFHYNPDRNSYTKKISGKIVSALIDGVTNTQGDYIPGAADRFIRIDCGKRIEPARVTVEFYDEELYRDILGIARFSESESSIIYRDTYAFNINGYDCSLRKTVGFADREDYAGNFIRVNYDIYIYTIDTGIEPASPLLEKKADRENRREKRVKRREEKAVKNNQIILSRAVGCQSN